MILEKEILIWKESIGITLDFEEVLKLPKNDFPKLIFQDFMNQLKISKIKIGFEKNTNQLIEIEPNQLEISDETIRFDLKPKNTINQSSIILYYLLCQVLETAFDECNIYTNNNSKSELFFESLIPFSQSINFKESENRFISLITKINQKEKQLIIERFFILLGEQYKGKIVLFLTYLDTKYNFKLDKNKFIEATLNSAKLKKIERQIKQLIL